MSNGKDISTQTTEHLDSDHWRQPLLLAFLVHISLYVNFVSLSLFADLIIYCHIIAVRLGRRVRRAWLRASLRRAVR